MYTIRQRIGPLLMKMQKRYGLFFYCILNFVLIEEETISLSHKGASVDGAPDIC